MRFAPLRPLKPTDALLSHLNPIDSDEWSAWLMHDRHANDPTCRAFIESAVLSIADRVLNAARLGPGMRLADIGAGEGILAFRALARMDNAIETILTDISAPMLEYAKAIAARKGIAERCRFLRCSAEKLTGIADASLDAVTTRASLAYVADKKAAFSEFKRILKPAGRLSIAEPILQDEAFTARALRMRLVSAIGNGDPFLPLLHRWKAAQFPDDEDAFSKHPLVNFSERDLLNMARAAGFKDLHLELHIDVNPSYVTDWRVFLDTAPHPWAPSLRKILAEQFSTEERSVFERNVRPAVEAGSNFTVDRVAYLSASNQARP